MPRLSNLPPGVTDHDIEEQAGAFDEEPLDAEIADSLEPCGCRYCRCHAMTLYGVTCSDCIDGAHQG